MPSLPSFCPRKSSYFPALCFHQRVSPSSLLGPAPCHKLTDKNRIASWAASPSVYYPAVNSSEMDTIQLTASVSTGPLTGTGRSNNNVQNSTTGRPSRGSVPYRWYTAYDRTRYTVPSTHNTSVRPPYIASQDKTSHQQTDTHTSRLPELTGKRSSLAARKAARMKRLHQRSHKWNSSHVSPCTAPTCMYHDLRLDTDHVLRRVERLFTVLQADRPKAGGSRAEERQQGL